MKLFARIGSLLVAAAALFSGATKLSAQSQTGPQNAQDYAQSVEVLLKAAGALSRFMPRSGEALSFSEDRLSDLNQARADAERVMNDPALAFLPLPEQKSNGASPPLCGETLMTCNPLSLSFDAVLASPRTTFRNECTQSTSRGMLYLVVDCPGGWRSNPRVLRKVDDWDGRGSQMPARITQTQTRDRILYKGFSFSDACTPCRKK